MENDTHEIIIIGAGACGLMAAWELIQAGKNVLILEARERIGGRIHTVEDPKFEIPVELGAEFIHGDLKLTETLIKKAGIKTIELNGEIWHKEDGQLQSQDDFIEDFKELNKKFKSLKEDISVHDFIEQNLQDKKYEELRFTLCNYVEGYYSANTKKASTFALIEELNSSSGKQYRPAGGYMHLVNYLRKKIESKGGKIILNSPVQKIIWSNDPVTIQTRSQIFRAGILLVTIPIGVLQSGQIEFKPGINDKIHACGKLGYGPSVKTTFQFENAFWKEKEYTQGKNLDKVGFIFSDTIIPTWWTQYPKRTCIITGWSGGPHAEKLKGLSPEQIADKGLESLSTIFNIDKIHLRQLVNAWHVADWMNDPFSYGAYSYEVVNGKKAKDIIKNPLQKKVYFAGEGLHDGPEIGTVEGALISGRDVAYELIAG